MDLSKFLVDEPFQVKSLAWYPNHFNPINVYNKDSLQPFSHVVSLCPTDAKMIEEQMPEKKVRFIPHIISMKNIPKDDKETIRNRHNIPSDAFVVLINVGNYDHQNRKSLDTSLLAFEKFQKRHKNCFLYIHAFNIKAVFDKHNASSHEFLEINDLIKYIDIPKSTYVINEKILEYKEILELMKMSDVLLQGSKSEGFGVPVLEAQMLGIPVVTNKFGAMSDYTFYGISVPPAQKHYDHRGRGMWSMPCVDGLAEALYNVYKNNGINNAEYAQKKITDMMSKEVVVNKFIEIFDEPFEEIKNTNIRATIIHYTCETEDFLIDNNEEKIYAQRLRESDIKGKWVVFIDNSVEFNKSFISTLPQSTLTDVILFKTQFNNGLYPTNEMLQNPINLDFSKIYYMMNANKFKILLKNNPAIENKYLREGLLLTTLKTANVTVTDNFVCKEVNN